MTQVIAPAPGRNATMTAREVAALFRVDPHTVHTWARRGRLTKAGRGLYWRHEIDALLRGRP